MFFFKPIKMSARFYNSFGKKHIGVGTSDRAAMLTKVKAVSIKKLIEESTYIRKYPTLDLPPPLTETQAVHKLKTILDKNKQNKSYIGMGYHDTVLPYPIKKHILQNPKWYTAYTPYQSEISQGRLESQYNFQTLIKELTGLPVANGGLLDEGSSAVEALNLMYNYSKKKKNTLICSDKIHPQTLDILRHRGSVIGIDVKILDLENTEINTEDVFGVMFQYPNTFGNIVMYDSLVQKCKENDVLTCGIADILSLVKLRSPKEIGLDIALGTTQRFGVPMWFGGPHPCYFAVEQKLIRLVPGRIIGRSHDDRGNKGYRLGLQTREQHIRHDKATSNICTSQSLLTNVVALYSMYHGKEGLTTIYDTIHRLAQKLEQDLSELGIEQLNTSYFDTLHLRHPDIYKLNSELIKHNRCVRPVKTHEIVINIDETTTEEDINFIVDCAKLHFNSVERTNINTKKQIERKSSLMNQDIFKKYNTETKLMRYIYSLGKKDYTLCEGMIPLGSCTMKLNSCSQLEPLLWDSMNIHPYLPKEYTEGYTEFIDSLGSYLKEITGFDDISFQSNSGSMGEYMGLLVIKKYLEENNHSKKNTVLIPHTAHGTNFASANLSGLNIIKYEESISMEEFHDFVSKHKETIACIMITYPNTTGVFNENIKEICDTIHDIGGLVYLDGANMNALVGIAKPSELGADICHLNLHKTFCIPHGGGGPGMGPVLCNKKLSPYLPKNPLQVEPDGRTIGNITSSQWSSASILSIPYIYISTMGATNLTKATETAILSANYLKECLDNHYTIKDVNTNGRVGHEFIIDTKEFNHVNITENDICKRLMDYSFHPPTMSWPRNNVMMFEPTESEDKEELDRLVSALISIRKEIKEVEDGKFTQDNNIIKNSPHSTTLISEEWAYPYSQKKAYYPEDYLKDQKFHIPIGRIDNVKGDRELLKK